MRPAEPADRDWIEDELRARRADAMFPLANLRSFGWESDAPRAMRFWVDREAGLLLAVTVEGMAMPVAMAGDPAAAKPVLAGREVIGALGAAREVRPFLGATGLAEVAKKLDEDEPQFHLPLDDLAVPEGPGRLVPLREIDRDLAVAWRTGYVHEALGEPEAAARETAELDVARYLATDTFRALVIDGAPVSMTGVNAALPDIVQIGGVWTPPGLRGRGYARRAVGLHLRELEGQGVREATLFASGASAVRAYEALGFRRTGTFSLVLFADATVVDG